MISLEKISQKIPYAVPSHIVERLTAPTNSIAVNQRILGFLLSYALNFDLSVKREMFFPLVAVLQDIAGSDQLEMSRQFQKG